MTAKKTARKTVKKIADSRDRLVQCFARCASARRAALMTFVTAGDPNPNEALRLAQDLPAAGADIVEIGLPVSDPHMDGPVIQAAHARSRAAGATARTSFSMTRAIRAAHPATPIVLMGYRETFEFIGPADLARDAARAGADAILIVDPRKAEAAALAAACAKHGLWTIPVVPPDMAPKDAGKTAVGGGFAYCVASPGRTGEAQPDPEALGKRLKSLRKHVRLPLMAGFGIRTPELAAAMARHADGIAVGTALAERMAAGAAGVPAGDWRGASLAFVKSLAAVL
jgi:tryptophan synthase alpha chain